MSLPGVPQADSSARGASIERLEMQLPWFLKRALQCLTANPDGSHAPTNFPKTKLMTLTILHPWRFPIGE